jgi:hypothetical protein
MPPTCRWQYRLGSAQLDAKPTFAPDFCNELSYYSASAVFAVRKLEFRNTARTLPLKQPCVTVHGAAY